MKHTVLAIPLLYLTAQLAYAEPTFVPEQDPKPTDMAWQKVEQLSDEFDGTAPDHSKWQDRPVGNGWKWVGRPPGLFKPRVVKILSRTPSSAFDSSYGKSLGRSFG